MKRRILSWFLEWNHEKGFTGCDISVVADGAAGTGHTLQGIRLVATAVADKKAVIKLPGESLADGQYSVRPILGNHLVLQERDGADEAADLIWIYIVKNGQPTRIQRLSSRPSSMALVPGLTESLV
ncbi:hypothetical protein Maes01_02311 [Microbulbifer aestuariivivens]|uniref:Uncharacterized protein n=1 Tax=Microbulbifer aestuariivivens TaxID=1908308 RepID=A0ABP9WRB6_9GAMM